MSDGKKAAPLQMEQLKTEYLALEPLAQRFAQQLEHQLQRLVDIHGISLGFPIQRRVKSWQSLAEKLERKTLTLSSLRELNDFVGLRLVLSFTRDARACVSAICETLAVEEQVVAERRLKEDQFGYSSTHIIARIPQAWLAVPTLSEMSGLKAEIQVRTTAQHIWASASHVLQYKRESSIPLPVRRAIHRVSALLETVDLEFERVLADRDAYRADLTPEQGTESLNVDLLENLLDALLPLANKSRSEDYAQLLLELQQFEVLSASDLKQIIQKHLNAVLEEDRAYVAMRSAAGTGTPRTESGVFFTHSGLVRNALRLALGKPYEDYLLAEAEPGGDESEE